MRQPLYEEKVSYTAYPLSAGKKGRRLARNVVRPPLGRLTLVLLIVTMARKLNPKISVRQTRVSVQKTHPRRKKHDKDQQMRREHDREVYNRVPTERTEDVRPSQDPAVHRFENICLYDDEHHNYDVYRSGKEVRFEE